MDWIWAPLAIVVTVVLAFLRHRWSVSVKWAFEAHQRLLSENQLGEELAASEYLDSGYWAWLLTNTGKGVARNVEIVFDFDPRGVSYGKIHIPRIDPLKPEPVLPKRGVWPLLDETADPSVPHVKEAHANITWGNLDKRRKTKRVRVYAMPIEHS